MDVDLLAVGVGVGVRHQPGQRHVQPVRHRGAAVCQGEVGNATFFRCVYHGWTYGSAGELIGVPFDDGYGESFQKQSMGLVHVPRVAS